MSLDWLIPLLFFPFFIALWTGVTFLLGAIGGWRTLAQRYRTAEAFPGRRWSMQSGRMGGFVNYNHILTVGAEPRGLFLGVMGLFRAGHPPLFIPWEAIEMRERRGFFFTYVDFTFRDVPGVRLSLYKKLAQEVAQAAGRPLPVFA